MEKAEIPYLSATELAGLIQSQEVSPVEAVEAYLDRIERMDPSLNCIHHGTAGRGQAGGQNRRRRNRRRKLSRPSSRNSDSSQGSDSFQGNSHYRRLENPPRFCPHRGRHRSGSSQGGGSHSVGQAKHERVRSRRSGKFRLRSGPQSLGPGAQPGHLQHRIGCGHSGISLRHLPGRRHGRLHSRTGGQLRSGGLAADMGPRQSLRCGRRLLVHRHHRAHIQNRNRLRYHHWCHRRLRRQ